MRIAILGATSHIAQDFIRTIAADAEFQLGLFARCPARIERLTQKNPVSSKTVIGSFEDFENGSLRYDAIINFVGSGNPSKTESMGAAIMDVTLQFDDIALKYIKRYPGCRYIFLSSGAAYGGDFILPVNDDTKASFSINHLGSQDWYGLAKFYAEARHRAIVDLPIIDLRIFNYFSATSDIDARFLITDAMRAIRDGRVFQTSSENIFRDYVGPKEVAQLIVKALQVPPQNVSIDCYSLAPTNKILILEKLEREFGLSYELTDRPTGLVVTGIKLHYYSTSRRAFDLFGYVPLADSLEVLLDQARRYFSHH